MDGFKKERRKGRKKEIKKSKPIYLTNWNCSWRQEKSYKINE